MKISFHTQCQAAGVGSRWPAKQEAKEIPHKGNTGCKKVERGHYETTISTYRYCTIRTVDDCTAGAPPRSFDVGFGSRARNRNKNSAPSSCIF